MRGIGDEVSRPEGDTYGTDRALVKPDNCYASAMTLIRATSRFTAPERVLSTNTSENSKEC